MKALVTIYRDGIYGGWEAMKTEHNRIDDPAFFGFPTLAEARTWLQMHFGATAKKVGPGRYEAEVETAA
jgi:hypothetical protein